MGEGCLLAHQLSLVTLGFLEQAVGAPAHRRSCQRLHTPEGTWGQLCCASLSRDLPVPGLGRAWQEWLRNLQFCYCFHWGLSPALACATKVRPQPVCLVPLFL